MEGPPSGGEGNSGTTPSRRCAEDGLTLIELAVAVTVFAVLVTGLAATMYSGLALTRNNRSRSVAANLASQEMDLVRSSDFTDLPLGLVSSTQDVDGIPYTVQRQSSWVPTGATTGACDSVGSDPAYLRVEVAVTWPNMQGVQPVRSDTLLTPPVGAYDPDSGHIAVKVRNREAAPLAAQPVTVTGPGLSRLLLTTTDGCAFFDHLPADTYTVALGTTGYVDRQGVAGPTQTAGVLAGATTSVGFDYDRSATLELTLTAPDGGTVPADLAVTLGNTQFLPDGRKTVPGSGNPRTVGGLFPFLDGYQAWAGDCADADPEGQLAGGSGAYWPGAQRAPAVSAVPGSATAGSVVLPGLDVTVTRSDLTPVVGASVVAVHDPDTGCPAGATVAVGTTDISGRALVALPYGTWVIQVDGETPLSAWPTAVLDPTGTGVPTVVAEVW